ncbi:extracellular solute-binding protein [Alkalihalobacillus sp. FSL W8-0930]
MKNIKKVALFLGICIGLLGLSACNENESASNNEEGKASNDPISIMAVLHTPEVPDNKLRELLEEKTDSKLDIQWVPSDNYTERLNTAFATGTLPQVVTVSNPDLFREAIMDGQFWEIGPYLDEFEHLSKLNPDILDNSKVDDKLYSLYLGRPLSRSGIIYRKDWADKLGLEAPTNVDEVFEMARAFTEDDPDGNGQDDTIGLVDRGEMYYGAFKTISSWHGTPNGWGEKDGVITPEFMFDEYMDTLNYIKGIHENGYMNQDFPVTSKTDQVNMFKTGKAGLYIGSMGDVEGIYRDATALNPDAEFDVHNYVEGPDGEYKIWSIPGYGSLLMFPKDSVKTEEDLKKILGFYDKLMETETMNLLVWGIEGEHYTVEDGLAKTMTENQQAVDREVRPFLSLEIGEAESSGRYEGYSEYEPKMKATELEKDNENYLIPDLSIGLHSEEYIHNNERLQEIINDATYKYVLGQIDEEGFNKAVENWKNQGGQKIMDEFTEHYKQRQ